MKVVVAVCTLIAMSLQLRAETKSTTRYFSVVAAGDFGLNPHRTTLNESGFYRHGVLTTWSKSISGVEGVFDGDVNFVNLETAVGENTLLRPLPKAYNFLSHPYGVESVFKSLNINLVSTANNHSIDYGVAGIRSTLDHLQRWFSDGTILAQAGIAANIDEAARPSVFELKGVKFAFGAIGIDSGGRATTGLPGQLAWRQEDDRNKLAQNLNDATAEFRILSVHYGQELAIHPEPDARRLLVDMLRLGNVDIILGHHAHVARGVEMIDGNVVAYGLGNFLHPGMQNMGRLDTCRDYGLIIKVHYQVDEGKRPKLRAIEAIPITDMHIAPQRMKHEEAKVRVNVLNSLSISLGPTGVRFQVQSDGTGIYCSSSVTGSDRIAKSCSELANTQSEPSSAPVSCSRSRIADVRRGRLGSNISAQSPVSSARGTTDATWVQDALGSR